MDQLILLYTVVSTCMWTIHALNTVIMIPKGYKDDFKKRIDITAMDTIIKANEYQANQVIDSTTRLREGDIAVSTGRRSNACFARSCMWSRSVDGHVYIAYKLSSKYNDMEKAVITRGMDNIEDDTCVRFVPRTHQRDYLDIQPKTGCWSYLGARGGKQTLSLQSPDCIQSGVASHELMHALGFVHEQSRADRDNYVSIMWANIWRDRVRNFEKFKTDSMDLPYDYSSIMHFGMYAYSEDGDPTIVAKSNRNIHLGQTTTLSHIDKLKINRLYKCGDPDDY